MTTAATRRASSKVGRSVKPENDCATSMPAEPEVRLGLLAHRAQRHLDAARPGARRPALGGAQDAGVVGAAQASVAHDRQDPDVRAATRASRAASRPRAGSAAASADDPLDALRVGAVGRDPAPGPATICDAAISSIALVIFFVDWTLRMRRRRTRSWPPAIAQSTLPVSKPSWNAFSALVELVAVGQRPGARGSARGSSGWLPLKYSSSSASKRRTSATGTESTQPLVPA